MVNTFGILILAPLQNVRLAFHVLLFFALLIVCVVVATPKNTASFVFTKFINSSGRSSDGVAWSIGLLSSSSVLTGELRSYSA
jgi:choline transport protein